MSAENSQSNSIINLGDLAKPAEILVERFCEGVGGVFRPRQIRRIAKAEADSDIIRAKADLEIQALATSTAAKTDVGQRAIQRMIQTEIQNQINMEEILSKAIEVLPSNADPSNLSPEFTNQVFENCKGISDEKLQTMWARLISEEAVRPGQMGKKSVFNILRTMDREDALLFEVFCSFIVRIPLGAKTNLYPIHTKSLEDYYKAEGIGFEEVNHLISLGLVSENNEGYKTTFSSNNANTTVGVHLQHGNRTATIEFGPEANKELFVGSLLLTRTGNELARICGTRHQPEAFQEFLRYLVKPNCHVYNMIRR